MALPPSEVMALTTASALSTFKSAIATAKPSLAKRLEMASPIP